MKHILMLALFATFVGILLSGRGARGPDGSFIGSMGEGSTIVHAAHERAKALWSQAPVNHEIIEEQDAEKFGRQLLELIEHQR